jgi:hypothetical protein
MTPGQLRLYDVDARGVLSLRPVTGQREHCGVLFVVV